MRLEIEAAVFQADAMEDALAAPLFDGVREQIDAILNAEGLTSEQIHAPHPIAGRAPQSQGGGEWPLGLGVLIGLGAGGLICVFTLMLGAETIKALAVLAILYPAVSAVAWLVKRVVKGRKS